MTGSNRGLSPATRVAQALRYIDPEHGAVIPPIQLATTYARNADYETPTDIVYARDGGPTVRQAEAVLAELDGGAASALFASGMAAIVGFLETLEPGDHIVAPDIMYHGGLVWLKRLAAKRGQPVSFFDAGDPGALARAIRPGKTKLFWIETPTNPNWDVIDIRAAAAAAHGAGAVLVADCTAAPPCTQRALDLGADYVFHSATKYLAGHSDLTGGVITAAETGPRWDELLTVRNLMGTAMAGFEAWLLIRGLRTLYLRYERASASALRIARHFEGHPRVAEIRYPGLPSHPAHAVATAQMTGGYGGMMAMLVNGSDEMARDVARHVRVFYPATSLGGVESLIEHRKAVEPPESKVPGNLLRISVGIEDPEDLIADLEAALEAACP